MLEFPIDLLGQSQYLYHLFAVILELLLWTRNHPLNIYKVPYISKETFGNLQFTFVSKMVCLQILEQLRKGFRVLKVIRTGADRSVTYAIEGIHR